MNLFSFFLTGVLTVTDQVASLPILDRTDPASYTCSEFLGAGTPPSRERAESMVYWVTGYVQGRLTEVATVDAHTWSFDDLSGHVTRALFELCRDDPAQSVASIADQIVQNLTKSSSR